MNVINNGHERKFATRLGKIWKRNPLVVQVSILMGLYVNTWMKEVYINNELERNCATRKISNEWNPLCVQEGTLTGMIIFCKHLNERFIYKQWMWKDENNRIYHHTVEGTRESHPSVHDLQSTTRLAESWMLQIMDTRMGFPCPFHNVVIDYFSPTPFILINNPISTSWPWHRSLQQRHAIGNVVTS